jgi:hypothetical protein
MYCNNTIFKNDFLNEKLLRDGYVVIDFLDKYAVQEFSNFFNLYGPENFEGIFGSVFFWDYSINSKLYEMTFNIIQPKIEVLFNDWFVEGASFIAKYPSLEKKSDFNLHQDYNMIDESKVPSIGLWIPMVDTCKINGGLCVLPGSHKKFAGTIRGANLPSRYIPITPEVEKIVTFLDIKAGQACFFFHSLFHGSLNNNSKEPRVIIHAGLFPDESVPVHYFEVSDESGNSYIEILKFNRLDYYKNINAYLENPKNFPHEVIGIQKEYTPKPTVEDVLKDYKPQNRLSKIISNLKNYFS